MWYLQCTLDRLVVAKSRDKGYLQRLSRRILASNGGHPSEHMLCRYRGAR
jgi:hypothetical protein